MTKLDDITPGSYEPQVFSDESKMPFGKYEGMRLGDVPLEYITWLYDQEWVRQQHTELFEYCLGRMEDAGEDDD